MTLRFEAVALHVNTATRQAGFQTSFKSGLNVIEAPNSWGKSTLIQSLVYGLGLEGAFSTSHLSPLGEAMSSVIELDGQREAVVDSYVTLTLSNGRGEYLQSRRFARSPTYDNELIQAWSATSRGGLETAEQHDYYVRQGGAATRTLGFHRLLEEFIGLELPVVPGFNSEEVKLYLEVILPLFYVEQKYGWSGLAPRVPTHFRIRSPYRRAAEFVLGLGSLERLKEIERLKVRLARLQQEQVSLVHELSLLGNQHGWTLYESENTDTSGASFESVRLGSLEAGTFTPADVEISRMTSELKSLVNFGTSLAMETTSSSQRELDESEIQASRLAAQYRLQREKADSVTVGLQNLTSRLQDLELDRERLVDLRKLERLGSEVQLTSLDNAQCPTCEQSLDSGFVATGIVMDIVANLKLLDSERNTLRGLIDGSQAELAVTESRVLAIRREITELRRRIRILKDELSGPSTSPSVAQIQYRVRLSERVDAASEALATSNSLLGNLQANALNARRAEDRLKSVRNDTVDGGDAAVVSRFKSQFSAAISSFGLRSLPPEEVSIGADSLLPEHDGFELSFDIRHGLSASDSIRTKWAYYVAVAQVTAEIDSPNRLGVLIMDEPRQQEAEFDSIRALYRALESVGSDTQVIVGSSASQTDLDEIFVGRTVNRIRGDGTHMLVVGN